MFLILFDIIFFYKNVVKKLNLIDWIYFCFRFIRWFGMKFDLKVYICEENVWLYFIIF